tara:strand:+ start:605 stop:1474 length:870 start_codon:yes stop_codon:yes gene_type:complete
MDLDLLSITDVSEPKSFKDGDNLVSVIKKYGSLEGAIEPITTVRASQALDLCPRYAVFTQILPLPGEGAKFDSKANLRMATGTFLHSFFQDEVLGPAGVLKGFWRDEKGEVSEGFYPKEEGVFKYQEYDLKIDSGLITGHVDGLVCLNRLALVASGDPITDDVEENLVHLEIKTTDDGGVKKVRDGGSDELPLRYKTQATIYQRGLEVDETLFLYVDRKYFGFATFLYRGEDSLYDDVVAKAHSIPQAMEDKVLPERHSGCLSASFPKAKACPYKDFCFAENAEDVWDL